MKDIQNGLAEAVKRLAEITQTIKEVLDGMTPEQRVVIEFLAKNPKMAEAFQELNQKLAKKKVIDAARVNELIDKIHPEPLIKDEKIRKAIRAWAEANDVDKMKVAPFAVFDIESTAGIYFRYRVIEDNSYDEFRYYTIAELCGEEE